ncbi:MAG: hypothetical protein AB2761_20675 [Candidatus Thiodiazotropha endolucinida]
MNNSMTTIPVHVSVYEHGHGMDIYVSASTDAECKKQADVARQYWNNRQILDSPDDHSGLSDETVCRVYFDNHENEFCTTDQLSAEIDLLSVPAFKELYEHLSMVARFNTTDDFENRGSCMENDDAVNTVNRLITEARDIIQKLEEYPDTGPDHCLTANLDDHRHIFNCIMLDREHLTIIELGDWILTTKPIMGDVDEWGEVTAPSKSIGYVCGREIMNSDDKRPYLAVTVAFPPGIICVLDEHDTKESLSTFFLMAPSSEDSLSDNC